MYVIIKRRKSTKQAKVLVGKIKLIRRNVI